MKAPASSRTMPFLKEGEIHRRKKCSERLKELDRKTFDQLVTGKSMINFIAHRMAESGLMFDNLKSAYRVHGVEGIQNLLTEKRDNGGPRVTKNAAVIDRIVQYFT